MASNGLILVRCRISRGGFSSEKVFRVTLNDGTEHIGAAPAGYFFLQNKRQLPPDQPSRRGEQIAGFLTARIVAEEADDVLLVSVPLDEVLRLKREQTAEYPQEGPAHVPVQS
jgi:hypothetical protein